MKTYRFDPSLVMSEMTEICDWARANNLVAETIPVDAKVAIDDGRLTVEVHADRDGNPTRSPRFEPGTNSPVRGTVTVPLLAEPSFVALKPA